jgi:hypothetical protein
MMSALGNKDSHKLPYVMSPQDGMRILTFIVLRWVSEYLNFNEWFMKNALFEQKKIKL